MEEPVYHRPRSARDVPPPHRSPRGLRKLAALVWSLLPYAALIAALVAGTAWTHRSIIGGHEQQMEKALEALLGAKLAAIQSWLRHQEATASCLAKEERLVSVVRELLAAADRVQADRVQADRVQADRAQADRAQADRAQADEVLRKEQAELRGLIAHWLKIHRYAGFLLIDPSWRVVGASEDEALWETAPGRELGWLDIAFAGNTTVTPTFPGKLPVAEGAQAMGEVAPLILTAAPIRQGDQVIAVLALQIRPLDEFNPLLTGVHLGESGETYAFDRDGIMISASRFDEQLKEIGLVPDRPNATSMLSLRVADPEVDMTKGKQPALPRDQQPLTEMAALATGGHRGVNAQGYRDYRGVPVVGAWAWLPQYGFGVATEIDVEEAYGGRLRERLLLWLASPIAAASILAMYLHSVRRRNAP